LGRSLGRSELRFLRDDPCRAGIAYQAVEAFSEDRAYDDVKRSARDIENSSNCVVGHRLDVGKTTCLAERPAHLWNVDGPPTS
jgi:hypothetical protein